MIELKDKIKRLRKQYNLSLEKFANIIGVSDTAILKWEKGVTEPKASNLIALANNFDVSIDELLEINPKLNIKLKQFYNSVENSNVNTKNINFNNNNINGSNINF